MPINSPGSVQECDFNAFRRMLNVEGLPTQFYKANFNALENDFMIMMNEITEDQRQTFLDNFNLLLTGLSQLQSTLEQGRDYWCAEPFARTDIKHIKPSKNLLDLLSDQDTVEKLKDRDFHLKVVGKIAELKKIELGIGSDLTIDQRAFSQAVVYFIVKRDKRIDTLVPLFFVLLSLALCFLITPVVLPVPVILLMGISQKTFILACVLSSAIFQAGAVATYQQVKATQRQEEKEHRELMPQHQQLILATKLCQFFAKKEKREKLTHIIEESRNRLWRVDSSLFFKLRELYAQ